MLKKLMSGIVIGSMVLSMVGCSSNEQPKEQVYIIKHVDSQGNETKEQVTKQEYDKQVKEAKEAGKKVTTETKDTTKEEVKKDTTKKEQNDNIDPETGLAKVKHGTHLEQEAKKQEEDDSIWTKDYCPECKQPIDDCICDGDGYTNSNLNDVQEYQCSNCGDYYTEGAEHTCTSQYTDYEGNTVVETWKNGQMVDTTTIYNNDAEPDEFNNEDTEEY